MADDDRRAEREARRRARMEKMQEDGDGDQSEATPNVNVEEAEDDSSSRREPEEAPRRDNDEDDRKRRDDERRKEEIAQERQVKQKEKEQKEKKEQEDAAKKTKRPGAKKKGLGGLSPEKKRLLKQLIMQKAAEEMKAEMKRRQEEKENKLKTLVGALNVENLDQAACNAMCKKLHDRIAKLEGEKYDWEVKIRNQDFDINELTVKVNDIKGKFVKPVLKKVNKTESKLARLGKNENKQSLSAFRGNLKSTGQNKFALEEKEEGHPSKTDWREHLKASKEGGEDGDEAPAVSVEGEAPVEA